MRSHRSALALAALMPFMLGGCQQSSAGDVPESLVRSQLESARSALQQALDDDRLDARTTEVTRWLLDDYGYEESKQVEVVVGLGHGDYCVYALPSEQDGEYGMDENARILFTDSVDHAVRTAGVADNGLLPDFTTGPCSTIADWFDL